MLIVNKTEKLKSCYYYMSKFGMIVYPTTQLFGVQYSKPTIQLHLSIIGDK